MESLRSCRTENDRDIRAVSPPAAGERLRWRDRGLILLFLVPLFLHLGRSQLTGSEGRWLLISSSMMETGDWLDPELEGEFYGDKPLLSYWAIALTSLAQGHLDEAAGRFPSALAGALTVFMTGWMATRLLGRRAGLLSACVLATSFTFLAWSRIASANLLSLAFSTAAVVVYLDITRRFSPWKTMGFFLLLALGGHTKGTPAILVPLAVAGADILVNRRWRLLGRAGWISLGFLAGASLYFAPFCLSYLDRGDWGLLALAWRENFVRAFHAFDHRDSVLYYAYTLPAMLLPWGLWLPGALGWAGKRFRSHAGFRFALLAFVVIFAAFTASQSRRSYYILPVFPFCAILIAGFLSEVAERWERRIALARPWRVFALLPLNLLCSVVVPVCALFLLAGPVLPGRAGALARVLPGSFAFGLALVACFAVYTAARLRGRLAGRVAAAALTSLAFALYLSTGYDAFRNGCRTEKVLSAQAASRYPSVEKVFYRVTRAVPHYYLGPGRNVQSLDEVRKLLEEGKQAVFLVAEPEELERIRAEAPVEMTELLRARPAVPDRVVRPGHVYALYRCTALDSEPVGHH